MLEEYLKEDGTLDYQKIYKVMQGMSGLNKDKNRKEFYDNMIVMYKAHTNPSEVPF